MASSLKQGLVSSSPNKVWERLTKERMVMSISSSGFNPEREEKQVVKFFFIKIDYLSLEDL